MASFPHKATLTPQSSKIPSPPLPNRSPQDSNSIYATAPRAMDATDKAARATT